MNFLLANKQVTLLILLGLTSIYLLLPRPRPIPLVRGLAFGALALVMFGLNLILANNGSISISPEGVLFYSFSALAILGACLMLVQTNPARVAISFALVVLSVCGLFLLLAAPFLMAATIIIYAGAIIVTFLFALMLSQQQGYTDADNRSREPFLATASGFVFLGILLIVLRQSYEFNALVDLGERAGRAAQLESLEGIEVVTGPKNEFLNALLIEQNRRSNNPTIGLPLESAISDLREAWDAKDPSPKRVAEQLGKLSQVCLQARLMVGRVTARSEAAPVSAYSGIPPTTPAPQIPLDRESRPRVPSANVPAIARSLYTDYLLTVEVGGTLLLVATIGAIAIAGRRSGGKS